MNCVKKTFISILFSLSTFADQSVIIDPYYSPYMGANDLLFSEWGLTKIQDLVCTNHDQSTLSIFGRALEQSVWYAINLITSTTQHEVFGHGYRLRELGIHPSKYTIGAGSGATYFSINEDTFLVGQMLAVDVAGLEAESILARTAKMNWLSKESIDGRLALTYFTSQQSLFFYTLITHLTRLRAAPISAGNDVDSYLTFLNATYPHDDLNIGNLTLWSAFNLLDPMTFYSLYSWFYYIAEGKAWTFPVISLCKNIRYLPNIKIGYAPYGPEAYFENFLTINKRPLYVYVKGGKGSGGSGFSYEYFVDKSTLSLGFHFDNWLQRQYLSDKTIKDFEKGRSVAAPSGKILGAAASIVARTKLLSCLQLFLELGGKTNGYLPGYTLSGGLVIRGGLNLTNY